MSDAIHQITRAYQVVSALQQTEKIDLTLEMRERGILVKGRNQAGTIHSESLVLWDWMHDPHTNWLLTYIDRVAGDLTDREVRSVA